MPRDFKVDQSILEPHLKRLRRRILYRYNSRRIRTTGYWGRNTKFRYTIRRNKLTIDLLAPNYTNYIKPDGRPPGPAPYSVILKWVRDKQGLPPEGFTDEQFAWVVVRKLKQVGSPVPNQYNPGDLLSPIPRFIEKGEDRKMVNELAGNITRQLVTRFVDIASTSKLAKNRRVVFRAP